MNKLLHGRYQIITKIGAGASSEVFLVNDIKLDCYWAVKKIEKGKTEFTRLAYENMCREVVLLAGLHHQGIPRIIDRFQENSVSYAVMDFVDGISLKHKVKSSIPSETEVVHWMLQVAEVLIYLHTSQSKPIIFRDLKPENILLDRVGNIQLIDFGSAVIHDGTQEFHGVCLGTRGFASPEQCQPGLLDARSDMYSFGATIYYLMTSHIYQGSLHELHASQGLYMIVSKCLMKHPDERYSSMQDVYEELKNIDKLNLDYRLQLLKISLPFLILSVVSFLFLTAGFLFLQLHKIERGGIYEAAMQQEDYETAVRYHQNQIEPFLLYYAACKEKTEKEQDGIPYAVSRMEDLQLLSLTLKDKDELLHQIILDCIQMKHTLYYQKARHYIAHLEDQEDEIIAAYDVLLAYLVKNAQIEKNSSIIDQQVDLILRNMHTLSSTMQQIWSYELLQAVYLSDLKRFSYETMDDLNQREWLFVRALPQKLITKKQELTEQIENRWVSVLFYYALQYMQHENKEAAKRIFQHLIHMMTADFQVDPSHPLAVQLAEAYEYVFDLNQDKQMLHLAMQTIEEAYTVQNSQECEQIYKRVKRKMEKR